MRRRRKQNDGGVRGAFGLIAAGRTLAMIRPLHRTAGWIAFLIAGMVLPSIAIFAQEPQQPQLPTGPAADDPNAVLVEREPFDRITLDAFNNNMVMEIVAGSQPPPQPLPQEGLLIFERVDDEDRLMLQVPWEHVVLYETFNDLLLKEADEMIKTENFAQAYRNLLYVYDNGGKDDQKIVRQLRTVMYHDARKNFESGNYQLSLSILEDLFSKDPNFLVPGANRRLIDMILDCHNNTIEKLVGALDMGGARTALAAVETSYADSAGELIDKWRAEFVRLHDETMAEAARLRDSGDLLQARQIAQRAHSISPEDPTSIEFVNDLIATNPFVLIGVTQTAVSPNPDRLEHWASRRVGRLTERRLVEFTGFSDEGGRYEFVSGRVFQKDETGLTYRFQIEPQKTGFAIPRISAQHLARQLLDYADADNPKCVVAWAKNVDTVAVIDDYTVDVRLKVPLVRPEAYLHLPFANEYGEFKESGPYIIKEQTERITRFVANPAYTAEPNANLPELVEMLFENQSVAADALLRGEIDVIDRVSPNDMPRLRRDPEIEVRSYLIPTVHMLVPNRRNEFVDDPWFRGGLMKAINRKQILDGMSGRGQGVEGTETLDGPFPIGMENLDQIAYGYNRRITRIPFNEPIGMALVEISRQARIAMRVKKGEQNPVVKVPEIVLAYPEGDVPGVTCTSIAQMWTQIGVPTKLRKLPPGVTIPPDEDYDFLYVEIMMTEPLADAEFLFGPNGLVKKTNAAIEQMTRHAGVSTSWRSASNNLRQLHRQVNNDMSILPLWQMREFYAYRRNLREIGRDLLFVYQNVDRWRLDPIRSNAETE